jgi:predicted cobalt transporter CbtA
VKLLRWQNIAYIVGLVALLAGVLMAEQTVILVGAVLLSIAAVLYAGNVFKVLLHKVKDLKPFVYGNPAKEQINTTQDSELKTQNSMNL